jgi:energy-coupling factor transporter transmembrane protein EcfT
MCGAILPPMRTLYHKTPMKITVGYIALVVVLLIISNVKSDSEGRIFDYLIIGFPWFRVVGNDSIGGTALFLILNSLSVYLVALIFVESFEEV